ncbi:hypothetical protein [Bradyrhizobium sp. McL0615]|uniref:hypothetical protein n=1 Tax=Bradyrhizobium sp. McL0615 TaxID=3415673 RepID=UPI003CE80B51
MARFTLKGDQRPVDLDLPIDEAPSPPVAPAAPSTTPPEEAPPVIDAPSSSAAPSFSGLGTTFNNAIQAPAVSPSPGPVEQGGQGTGSVNQYTNELTTVHNGLLAEVSRGQLSGSALGHVQAILSDISTAISAANATANSGTFGSAAAAEQSVRASNLDIINTVKTDVALTNLALTTAPAIVPEKVAAADAPHANLAEIGAIFNDAADKILSGVNDANRANITDDIHAVITDMEALISANPQMFEGLTGQHADAVVRQLQLELTYINDPDISPDAARASIDNILDIIEIVQSDPHLADMATQGGLSGFSPHPGPANPAPTHLENDVQTVFAANFIAQSNSLGHQAVDLVGSGDTKAIATLIADLKAFEKFVADFDAAQGGNALLNAAGALGAEVAAVIKGLQTGDANLVTAAADQMHGNAVDVGGHNVPVTGGNYNTDGVTVTEVLATAPVAETPAAAAEPAPAHAAAPTISAEPVTLATADVIIGVEDHTHSGMPDLAHHHTWG